MAKIRIRHKGSLSKYGFNTTESEKKQMEAIHRADKTYGKGEVNKKLAAPETFDKHRPRERKRIVVVVFLPSPKKNKHQRENKRKRR